MFLINLQRREYSFIISGALPPILFSGLLALILLVLVEGYKLEPATTYLTGLDDRSHF